MGGANEREGEVVDVGLTASLCVRSFSCESNFFLVNGTYF